MAKKTNDLAVLDEAPKSKGKSNIPVLDLQPIKPGSAKGREFPGLVGTENLIAEYRQKASEAKAALTRVKEIEPYLLAEGFRAVLLHNADEVNPQARINSVRFADPLSDDLVQIGNRDTAMVTVQNSYPAFDREQVEPLLGSLTTTKDLPANPDDYLDWEVVAKFDTAVFNDAKGRFDRDRYEAFVVAIQSVADSFGVESPLTCSKKRVVREEFHALRLTDFTVAQNVTIQSVLPAKMLVKVA